MNAQIWYSQMGQARTTPAATPTLRRRANWSNGPVPKSTHALGSAVKTARDEAGIAQYGPLSTHPEEGAAKLGTPKQVEPKTVVIAIATRAMASRLRSS